MSTPAELHIASDQEAVAAEQFNEAVDGILARLEDQHYYPVRAFRHRRAINRAIAALEDLQAAVCSALEIWHGGPRAEA